MLNVQNSTYDKIGLGFVESISTSVIHHSKFVPTTSIFTPEVKVPKEEILSLRRLG